MKPEPKNGVAVPIHGRVAAGIPIDAIQEEEVAALPVRVIGRVVEVRTEV
ncbi:MAG: hypothetical protein IKZ43_06265 [Acidaminococcaceae bacterium]|nr:hypothetical protein [Acidaminococcaceae bacterium]